MYIKETKLYQYHEVVPEIPPFHFHIKFLSAKLLCVLILNIHFTIGIVSFNPLSLLSVASKLILPILALIILGL